MMDGGIKKAATTGAKVETFNSHRPRASQYENCFETETYGVKWLIGGVNGPQYVLLQLHATAESMSHL